MLCQRSLHRAEGLRGIGYSQIHPVSEPIHFGYWLSPSDREYPPVPLYSLPRLRALPLARCPAGGYSTHQLHLVRSVAPVCGTLRELGYFYLSLYPFRNQGFNMMNRFNCFDNRIRCDRNRINPFFYQELREIRKIRRTLTTDPYFHIAIFSSPDQHTQ